MIALLPLIAWALQVVRPPAAPTFDEARQIRWQRSLQDALALQAESGRPILVAVNMDGESASERIVRERYRDPQFVAWTGHFVCLVSSAFRHAARDHDEDGRRIPCPRLGEVTCGEHILLEPELYERFLGGERISPRHALIAPEGEKLIDLFLLFDLAELDRALAAQAERWPAARTPSDAAPALAEDLEARRAQWRELAAARSHRGRSAFERALLDARGPALLEEGLAAIAASGDGGSLEALRILLARAPREAFDRAGFLARAAEVARSLEVAPGAAAAVRALLDAPGDRPGSPELGQRALLLPLLARLDGDRPATRSLLLSFLAAGSSDGTPSGDERARALAASELLPSGEDGALRFELAVGVLADPAGPFPSTALDPARLLATARSARPLTPPPPAPADELPPEAEIEAELLALDEVLAATPGDPQVRERQGRALLALARRRMERGEAGALLLLEDAARALGEASEADPTDVDLFLARARAAFQLGRFEEEERLALEALALLRFDLAGSLEGALAIDDTTAEALRWLGDAAARLAGARSGGGVLEEAAGIARGARALAFAALSPEAGPPDWQGLASLFGALGRRRAEIALALEGVARFPESGELRSELHAALWAAGRPDLAPVEAERAARANPGSAAAAWYAGYAWILWAEWLRRGEEPDEAILAYRRAGRAFEESLALEPSFEDSAGHYLALAALGRGFAHLLADRQAEAAEALVEGIGMRPAIAGVRDGLDREALDLLDGALEWRAAGPSPVEAIELLGALERADPGDPRWAAGVADSELREGLRAEGRGNQEEAERYLAASLDAARRGALLEEPGPAMRALAQSATVLAEHLLERGEEARAASLLAEAASALGWTEPEGAAGGDLGALARSLRAELGDRRPIARPGR